MFVLNHGLGVIACEFVVLFIFSLFFFICVYGNFCSCLLCQSQLESMSLWVHVCLYEFAYIYLSLIYVGTSLCVCLMHIFVPCQCFYIFEFVFLVCVCGLCESIWVLFSVCLFMWTCLCFYCIQSMCASSLHSNVYVHLSLCFCLCLCVSRFEFWVCVYISVCLWKSRMCVCSFMVVSFNCVYMCLSRLYSF